MSFLRDFPGTDSYQGDLGWIICKIMEFHHLADTIEELQAALNNLPESIRKEVETQLQPIIANINSTLEGFGNRIDTAEDSVAEMKNVLSNLITWVSGLYGFIENYTDLIGQKVFNELKTYIDAWSKDLPPVVCPVDGKLEPISVALKHLFEFYNRGITAGKYDSLQITAQEYDDFNITARDYDAFGNDYFENIYACMMISPFTGEMEYISIVVNKLADFHKNGITAQEYDALNKTAQEYDNAEISAYEYDWNNPYAGNAGDYVQVGDLLNIQANKKLFSTVKE